VVDGETVLFADVTAARMLRQIASDLAEWGCGWHWPGRASLRDGWHRCLPRSALAEDKRFELLRGCPQHAFQVCGYASGLGHHCP
jgi:hypothetical protein